MNNIYHNHLNGDILIQLMEHDNQMILLNPDYIGKDNIIHVVESFKQDLPYEVNDNILSINGVDVKIDYFFNKVN